MDGVCVWDMLLSSFGGEDIWKDRVLRTWRKDECRATWTQSAVPIWRNLRSKHVKWKMTPEWRLDSASTDPSSTYIASLVCWSLIYWSCFSISILYTHHHVEKICCKSSFWTNPSFWWFEVAFPVNFAMSTERKGEQFRHLQSCRDWFGPRRAASHFTKFTEYSLRIAQSCSFLIYWRFSGYTILDPLKFERRFFHYMNLTLSRFEEYERNNYSSLLDSWHKHFFRWNCIWQEILQLPKPRHFVMWSLHVI